jgi:putative ABC transport system permease protein
LWILFGAVALVLLIACSNFASLLLTRSTSRLRDLSVRSALGAGRGQLVRLLVTESVLLAVIGGALGVLFSQWAVDLLLMLSPSNLPRLQEIAVDERVLAFALGLSVVTGIFFGLMPAHRAAQGAEAEALKRSGASVTFAARGHRLLAGLVTAQIALALVLLAGAGLLINGFWRLRSVPPGFTPGGVLTLRIELPEARYPDLASQSRYRARVFEALEGLPGTRAAMISELPLSGDALMHNIQVEGAPVPEGTEPELFSRSVEGATLVGVINQSMVRQYFPERSPIGQRVRWARSTNPEWITIVGVAADVRHFGLRQPEQPAIYTPYTQFGQDWKRWMHVVVRSERGLAALVPPVRARITSVDRDIPLTNVHAMEEVLGASLASERFNLVVLAVFAAVALALAVLGVFGVTAYAVSRRTREMGLRMALGASRADLWRMVIANGGVIVGSGLVIGLGGAFALTRLMRSLLYEVRPTDPVTLASVALVLGLASMVACAIPAHRATRMDPMAALRVE